MSETGTVKIRKALLSVSDKTGLVNFARELSRHGITLISTGGTLATLTKAGISATAVEQITGFPEMFDGRVKTLHPKIHGGILARRDLAEHQDQLKNASIEPIDLVVVNLYPFEQIIDKKDVSLEECIENIDIGGPTLLRSAAKNYAFVTVVSDPSDYPLVLNELNSLNGIALLTRQRLSVKAFQRTANYDSRIDSFLSKKILQEEVLYLNFHGGRTLRYGENAHQKAQLFINPQNSQPSLAAAELLNGKEMSYNNYLDAESAYACAQNLGGTTAAVVIKHTNPCGYATGASLVNALSQAWAGDPISAFGSFLALTQPVDKDISQFLKDKFIEGLIAPDFTSPALQSLKEHHKNLRLLKIPLAQNLTKQTRTPSLRSISGGILIQSPDDILYEKWECPTQQKFPPVYKALAEFALIACKHVKSNAIVLAREYESGYFHMLGMGAGQPNRIDAFQKLSLVRAKTNLENEYQILKPNVPLSEYIKQQFARVVLASDAFFPFPDLVQAAASAGIRYIVQPGGSLRDDQSISACNELGVSMVFTGTRHFLH